MSEPVRSLVRVGVLLFFATLCLTSLMVWLMQRELPWVHPWIIFWLGWGLVVGVAEAVSGLGVFGRGISQRSEPLPQANAESLRFTAAIVGVTALTSLVAAVDHEVSYKFPLHAVVVGMGPYGAVVCLAGLTRIIRQR